MHAFYQFPDENGASGNYCPIKYDCEEATRNVTGNFSRGKAYKNFTSLTSFVKSLLSNVT